MSENKLLPCPFCGSSRIDAESEQGPTERDASDWNLRAPDPQRQRLVDALVEIREKANREYLTQGTDCNSWAWVADQIDAVLKEVAE